MNSFKFESGTLSALELKRQAPWSVFSAMALRCFCFKPSDAINRDCSVVSNLESFRGARKRGQDRAATNVCIFFSEDKTRYFVNPLWLTDVRSALKDCSYGGKTKGKIHAMTCTTTWTFSARDDPELHRFEDFYKEKGVDFLKVDDLERPVRVLLPQNVRAFLKKGHDFEDEVLNDYTFRFQLYPKQETGRKDCHDFFASKLFESMAALAAAEASGETQKIIQHSSQLQLGLATRLGFSQVLAGTGKEEDDADALNPETVNKFEKMLLDFEQDEGGSFRQRQRRPRALLDDLRKMCSEQSVLKNPFGNIIVNAGKSTIIGGRLPVMTIGYEAARSLAFWDHEVHSPPEGDLHNEELLKMVRMGPCRDGGAWTLHLRYNEAVHVPERHKEDASSARSWLRDALADHLVAELSRKFAAARPPDPRSSSQPTPAAGSELVRICKAFLEGGSFAVLLDKDASPMAQWLRDFPDQQPKSRCLVTAVQRHARTRDLMVAVRHPITQPVPHYQLMVDATKTGFALAMPPQFGNLSELDYDGDKMKAAAERAASRRALLEKCLSVPKLMHSALGKRVVKLSGVAPLALNLAQQNGAAGLDPSGLRPHREGSVLWPGVLETVYSPSYFFDELCSVGLAVPGLLKLRWSRPCFEEVRFRALKKDGTWTSSCRTAVSHDGFYPVPAGWTAANKCGWIAADLQRHQDRFQELQQPFVLELEQGSRASALDGLTFAQMRSFAQTFTPKNFSSPLVSVPHVPGLVEHGSFSSFSVLPRNPWQRMAAVLLKLATLPTCLLGHDAVVTEMLRCTWRPSESQVARCILAKDYELKALGGLDLPQLPEAVQDRPGIVELALQHRSLETKGYLREAQVLRRFAFEPPSCEREELRSGRPLDLSEAKALWKSLDLSELRRIRAEPLPAEGLEFRLLQEGRFEEPLDESGWTRRLVFEDGPMRDEDWDLLERVAHEVGCLRRRRLPALKRTTLAEEGLEPGYLLLEAADDPLQYVRDWCRFVGAVQAPRRQAWDVEASLEFFATLCNDDFEYCAALSALEALGHLLANLLNQPTQNQVVMEEDAYCVAANLGLEDAKRKLYALEQNGAEDFSEVRRKILEVLRSVSLALSNGQHNGNLHLVRAAAGLLAVDWSLEQDTVLLRGERFAAARCDKLEGAQPRFSCWKVVRDGVALAPASYSLLYSVCLSGECLLQFDFPTTEEEALRLSGLAGLASPIRPGRWQRLCRAALDRGAREQGEPSPDFNRDLFEWDYRLYVSADGRLLVPLMECKKRSQRPCARPGCFRLACFSPPKDAEARFCRGHRTDRMAERLVSTDRFWCLVDEAFEVEPLFEAKPGLPPSDDCCAPGPDRRLPRALALLADSPEKLQLNRLAHGGTVGEATMQSGVPFLVGNMAAPRSNDKRAASSILRMPIFGAKYGVRARMDQPLGGEEISAACIGSASNSAMSVLENESRRARQEGNTQKEVTALWNKRATLKAGLAVQERCGRIYGPPIYDRLCRHVREGSEYPCMGLLSKKLECRSCKKVYAGGDGSTGDMRQLVRRKRLLEDPGQLLVSKKMRLKGFAPETHSVLRGLRRLNVMEALKAMDAGEGEVETVLPDDCRLSRDRASALAYPCKVVYYLGRRGLLQPCRAEQRAERRGGVPDLDPTGERLGVCFAVEAHRRCFPTSSGGCCRQATSSSSSSTECRGTTTTLGRSCRT